MHNTFNAWTPLSTLLIPFKTCLQLLTHAYSKAHDSKGSFDLNICYVEIIYDELSYVEISYDEIDYVKIISYWLFGLSNMDDIISKRKLCVYKNTL